MLWLGWLKNSPAERDLRVLVNKLMAKTANSLLGHIRKGIESMWREMVFCLYSALKESMENCVLLWLPLYKNKKDLLDQPSEGPQRWLGGWTIIHMRKAWKNWDCSAWRREAYGCLTHMFKYLMGWNEGWVGIPGSFQWCSEPRGNGHKLKTMKFHLNTRKHWSTVRLVKRCPERLRHLMSTWAWSWATSSSWLCVSKGVGLDGFIKCFPIETILLFWEWVVVCDYLSWGYRED